MGQERIDRSAAGGVAVEPLRIHDIERARAFLAGVLLGLELRPFFKRGERAR